MTIPLFTGRYAELAQHLAGRVAKACPEVSFGVLVPSRAAAAEIVRFALEQVPAGIAGLALYTPESLARSIVNGHGELPRAASDLERRLAMFEAARSLNDPTLPPQGLEAILDRSYRDIRDAGVAVSDLEAQRFRRRPRHELLFRAAHRYEENLRRMRLIDPADLLERAAELLRAGRVTLPPQVVFGFYDVTGVQATLLRALSETGLVESVYVPLGSPEAAESRFAARYLSICADLGAVERNSIGNSEAAAIPAVQRFTTPREEIVAICGSVRELLDQGIPAKAVGIVTRSLHPGDAALVERAAVEAGFLVTPRLALPLRGQRIGRAMLRLLQIREARFPRSWVIELLRDGLRLERVRGRWSVDRLDRLTRRFGLAGGPPGMVNAALEGLRARESEAAEDLGPFAAAIEEIESLTAVFSAPLSGPRWADVLGDLTKRFHVETERDLDALEEVDSIANMLRASARLDGALEADTVAGLLEAVVLAPDRADGPRVWFGDLMTMRGRSFRHVFAFAMEEDRFPQGRVPDPILTDADRAVLHLPTIGDGRDEETFLFRLMQESAGELHLSFATTDGFGKVLRPSPFLSRLPVMETRVQAVPPSPPSGPISRSLARQLRLVETSGLRGEHSGYIEMDEAMQLEVRRRLEVLSPTIFEDFGECPQKFLFRRLLRADELDDPEHEPQINHLEKGALDHTILERFYREAAESLKFYAPRLDARLPANLSALLERIVEEQFDRFDREHPPFNGTIRGMERRFTRHNLECFLLRDLEDLHDCKLVPIEFEYRFGTTRHGEAQHPEPIPIDLAAMRVSFRGSIDRIDRSAAKPWRYRVVDYKSGKALRHKGLADKIGAGHRLQLAIYAIAAEQIFDAAPEAISGTIKPLALPETKTDNYAFELADHKEGLIETLGVFVEAILAGRFPAFPDDAGACRYCPLGIACRTRHDPVEQRALRRFTTALELLQEEQP